MIHDTKNPLACCPRCHKAELAGRARKRPALRYEKVDDPDQPSTYRIFHGAHQVATLSRERRSGPVSYEVRVEGDTEEETRRAGSMRDARTLLEETYTATWRTGLQADRGPVVDL